MPNQAVAGEAEDEGKTQEKKPARPRHNRGIIAEERPDLHTDAVNLRSPTQDGRIRLTGPTRLKRDISTWLGKNYFADVRAR